MGELCHLSFKRRVNHQKFNNNNNKTAQNHQFEKTESKEMAASNLIKTFACVALLICMVVHQNEAGRRISTTNGSSKSRCRYLCTKWFDQCLAESESKEFDIVCYSAQAKCRKRCK